MAIRRGSAGLQGLLQDNVVTNELHLERFTVWVNSYLKKADVQVKDLTEDLRDGQILILLLELISGDRLPAPERGQQRIHHISNVNKAIEYLKTKDVKLAGIRAEEIVMGQWKATFGLIWTIIARFTIQDITVEDLHGKEALLKWCKQKTKTYENVDVQNFSTSFQDGLAFGALIHKHRPELIPDYNELSKDDPVHNLNYAFEIAENHLEIPKMLDAEELQTKADERAVMTYVSSYYHAFNRMQMLETAVKKITKALNVNQAFDREKQNYDHLASDILAWINQKKAGMNDRKVTGLQDMQNRWAAFRRYNFNEKSPKVDDKAKLENMFYTLQTKLRINNRPIYTPQDGKLVSDIDKAWKELEQIEKDLQDFVLNQLPRLARLDYLEKAFNHKCDARQTWNGGQEKYLKENEVVGQSLSNLLAARKRLESFEADISQQNRVEQMIPIAQELNELGYSKMDDMNGKIKGITGGLDKLRDLGKEQERKLVDLIEKAERLEPLVRKFNQKCDIHQAWSGGQGEYLKEDDNVWSLPDLLEAREHHEAFAKDLAAYEDHVKEIAAIGQELNTCGYDVSARIKDVTDGWEKLRDRTAERGQNLADKIEKVERQENVWLEYAKKVTPFNNWMDGAMEDLNDVFSVHTVKEINDLKDAHEKFKANQQNVQKEYESIAAIHPGDMKNPYTNTNVEDLKRKWDELQAAIKQRDQRLSDEATLQQNNEGLRVQFAQMANRIAEWIESRTQKLSDIGTNADRTLENQLKELKTVEEEIQQFKSRMEEVNGVNDKVQEAMILDNPHTAHTMETLQHTFKQLVTGSSHNINKIENEIMTRDCITEEQVKELRNSFDHYDKNSKNHLDYDEFKQCLVSLGHLNDADCDDKEIQRIIAVVDPNGEEFVPFQPFLDFIKGEMANTDTASQLMESFRVLARDQPFILADDLKKELSPEQAEYCITRMSPYKGADGLDGALDYQSFSRALYGVDDEV